VNLFRATQAVLDPARDALCPFLYQRVKSVTPVPLPACSDGVDNDGDRLADFPADPGCFGPGARLEDPDATEAPRPVAGCGLGPELVLVLPSLWWLRAPRTRARLRV
jgi:hypothetical protein